MEKWLCILQGLKEVDQERAHIWKCGMRWAVEAREERGGEQEQVQWRQDEQEQREQQEQKDWRQEQEEQRRQG